MHVRVGISLGQIEGIVPAMAIPCSYVAPRTWPKVMAVPQGKDGSRLRARELMPAYAECWRRANDDGRAEASLIAMWALLHLPPVAGIARSAA